MQKQEAFIRLGNVREELQAARFSLAQTLRAINVDPEVHTAGKQQQVTSTQIRTCLGNLEITYTVRLFAEFESILRDYWLIGRRRRTRPAMQVLIENLARYCKATGDELRQAGEVREYRNDVVHARLRFPRLDFYECQARLARYISRLPLRW